MRAARSKLNTAESAVDAAALAWSLGFLGKQVKVVGPALQLDGLFMPAYNISAWSRHVI